MISIFAVVYVLTYLYSEDIMEIFLSEETIAMLTGEGGGQDSNLVGVGMIGLLPAAITNLIANGFFEEFLYRGFILKRLKKLTQNGVAAAVVTAVLFGLMHNVLYIVAGLPVGLDYHVAVFIFTTIGALLHGIGNFIGSVLMMFSF